MQRMEQGCLCGEGEGLQESVMPVSFSPVQGSQCRARRALDRISPQPVSPLAPLSLSPISPSAQTLILSSQALEIDLPGQQ